MSKRLLNPQENNRKGDPYIVQKSRIIVEIGRGLRTLIVFLLG